MNSTIETADNERVQDAPPGTKEFTQNLKNEILSGVRETLAGQREVAQQAGNLKEVAKLDQAIAKIDRQITDVQVPKAPTAPSAPPGGTPIAGVPYGPYYGPGFRGGMPKEAVDVAQGLFITIVFCVVGLPIARAFARWIDRRGNSQPASREVALRLEAIEQAVESVAVEVERISEGQRFTTKLLNERAHDPQREYAAAERDPIASLPANSRRS